MGGMDELPSWPMIFEDMEVFATLMTVSAGSELTGMARLFSMKDTASAAATRNPAMIEVGCTFLRTRRLPRYETCVSM